MLPTTRHHLFNILLADDGSLEIHSAIQLLAALPHTSEWMVTALRVFTPRESSQYSGIEAETEKTTNLLKSHDFDCHAELVLGQPAETIIAYATEHAPDLIVMGAKGKGGLTELLGSVAANVVHLGNWPVLIVRPPFNGLNKVLLTTDGSPASQTTFDYLGNFPLPPTVNLEVMHVLSAINPAYLVEPGGMVFSLLPPDDGTEVLRENEILGHQILEKACHELSLHGLDAKKVLVSGDYVQQILAYASAHQIDLLVCGSRGVGNLTGLLMGSVSREIVLSAPCSVLVVRSPLGT